MTEILLPSSPSSIPSTPSSAPSHHHPDDDDPLFSIDDDDDAGQNPISNSRVNDQAGGGGEKDRGDGGRGDQHLSLLALLATIFRKPFTVACRAGVGDFSGMDIGGPTDVRHVAHVTFDRFNGFLGLPLELEPDVPRRAPSASATVFGVSTDSMQLSYDSRGNSIPTILLLMQKCLYDRGGLQAEGIFRIAAGNSQEEYVRDQLNRGVVPEDIDVHCLAGLIKAWFRELPTGVLDSLSSDQVIQCKSEEDYAAVMRHLPSADAALLDWAINLMADIVQQERENKMNAHNIAVVFAPNMTQVSDPETALNHSVKVMNFLSSVIMKTIRERERSSVTSPNNISPSPSLPCPKDTSRKIQETKPESCQSNELLNPASESPRREVCSSKKEKLPSSSQNGSEIGKQSGVKVMENDSGKSLGNKSSTTSEKLPSSQNSQSAVKVMGDDAGKSLGKKSSNYVNFKNSSPDKFPSSQNGSEIGKQSGVKVTENDSVKSLGNKSSTTSEKLPNSQNSQSAVKVMGDDAGKSLGKKSSNSVNFKNSRQDKFPSSQNGSEIGKQSGVKVMENDSGKSLGNKSSTTSEKLPSSQNSQSAVKVMGDDAGKSLGNISSNSVNFKNSGQEKFPSSQNSQSAVKVKEDDSGKSLGNKSSNSVNFKNSSQEKFPSSQNSQSAVKVKEDDAGKSLGNISSNSVNFKNSGQEKLPSSSQNSQSTVPNNRNGTEHGKQPGVQLMKDNAGKSLGIKTSYSANSESSCQEKLPSSQNRNGTETGKQPGVKVMEDDAGMSLGKKSSNSVNFKNSIQEKLPSTPSNVKNCENGPEIGKQHGVKLTADADPNSGDKSLYCMNTMSGRITEAWR